MAGGWSGNRPKMPAEWHRTRARVLRDQPTCYICRRRPSVSVDHVVNRASGGGEGSNLAGVCKPCHDAKSSREGNDLQREMRQRKRRPEGRHPGVL